MKWKWNEMLCWDSVCQSPWSSNFELWRKPRGKRISLYGPCHSLKSLLCPSLESLLFSCKALGAKAAPNVGLEPTTLRLRVSCSTDWASRATAQTPLRTGFGTWRLWTAPNDRMGQVLGSAGTWGDWIWGGAGWAPDAKASSASPLCTPISWLPDLGLWGPGLTVQRPASGESPVLMQKGTSLRLPCLELGLKK